MLARARRQGDVRVHNAIRALFPGQVYDLPADVVAATDWLEPVTKAVAPADDKAERPASNKAVTAPQRTKRAQGRETR